MSLWRCWVCPKCCIVSYHPINYCPSCPGKMEKVVDEANKLSEKYGRQLGWIPAEADSELTKAGKQPWVAKANDDYFKFVEKISMWMINQDFFNTQKGVPYDKPISEEKMNDYHEFEKRVHEAKSNKHVPMDYLNELLRTRLKEKNGDYWIDFNSLKSLMENYNNG